MIEPLSGIILFSHLWRQIVLQEIQWFFWPFDLPARKNLEHPQNRLSVSHHDISMPGAVPFRNNGRHIESRNIGKDLIKYFLIAIYKHRFVQQ